MDEHVSLETMIPGGGWQHVKYVPAWAMADRGHARIQRQHARALTRDWHGVGTGTAVLVRVVDENTGQVLS